MKLRQTTVATVAIALLVLCVSSNAFADQPKLKALIVDGQNNHGNWPQTTQMMKKVPRRHFPVFG